MSAPRGGNKEKGSGELTPVLIMPAIQKSPTVHCLSWVHRDHHYSHRYYRPLAYQAFSRETPQQEQRETFIPEAKGWRGQREDFDALETQSSPPNPLQATQQTHLCSLCSTIRQL